MSVLILGSVNTDLVIRSPRLPRPGETVLGGEFYQAAGGKGANQAVAAARALGCQGRVAFIGAVGNDEFGKESRRGLLAEGIDCLQLKEFPSATSGIALILVDVATRRIAWDWNSTKKMALAAADRVRAFTVVRKVESRETLSALKRVRDEVVEQKFRVGEQGGVGTTAGGPMPDPKAKFEARGVEGDISKLVGGAADKPMPPAPKKIEPKGAPGGAGGHTGSLLEAKRRAQQQIKQKEQGE